MIFPDFGYICLWLLYIVCVREQLSSRNDVKAEAKLDFHYNPTTRAAPFYESQIDK